MAGARRISGLDANDSYSAAAAKVVEVRAGELIEHARDVLDLSDIERVHDMRVATRRLRAALEIFELCFPRNEVKAGMRQVKALADALGERRDRDVAIAALEDIAASMAAPDRPGIETLIERLRAEQQTANQRLADFVSTKRLASLSDQLSELVGSAQTMSSGNGPVANETGQPGPRQNGDGGPLQTPAPEDAA
jgi:CHAD domain-containing protein